MTAPTAEVREAANGFLEVQVTTEPDRAPLTFTLREEAWLVVLNALLRRFQPEPGEALDLPQPDTERVIREAIDARKDAELGLAVVQEKLEAARGILGHANEHTQTLNAALESERTTVTVERQRVAQAEQTIRQLSALIQQLQATSDG